MKKLLSLFGLAGLATLLALFATPVFAQDADDVNADDEVMLQAEDEFNYGVDEDGVSMESSDEEIVAESESLDGFDFNAVFENEEVRAAIDEAGLTNEEAAGLLGLFVGLGALLLPLVIVGIILAILGVIALWKAFTRAGEKGWKAIIPIYNVYITYKLADMKNWFWYVILIAIIFGILAACFPDYEQLISNISYIVARIIGTVVSFKFARKYGWGVFAAVLFALFYPICILVLGFGNYPYEGKKSEETVVEA